MGETIVSMNGICKYFPGVKALDNVQFELRSGEVMALLGENGAGKSTLMKILSGVYTRDAGTMEIFGKPYGDLLPKQAQQVGVAIIHQELNMCRHLTVTENMFLGREKAGRLTLKESEMEAEARRILQEYRVEADAAAALAAIAADVKHGGMGTFVEILELCLEAAEGGPITAEILKSAKKYKLMY